MWQSPLVLVIPSEAVFPLQSVRFQGRNALAIAHLVALDQPNPSRDAPSSFTANRRASAAHFVGVYPP